eukprot:s1274_g12.t1
MSLSTEVKVQLQSFLQEAADGDKLVKVVENALDFLRKHHLVSTMKLEQKLARRLRGEPPGRAGPCGQHRRRRIRGASPRRWCGSGSQHVRDWNSSLFASANGLLGSMEPNLLKVTSICGSHTNSALRLFLDAVPHSNEIVCTGGRLSLEMLKAPDPAFYEAAMDGLSWDVVSPTVAQELREILELISSRSGNTSLQRGILASKPKCGTSVPHMYTFCLKASGGATGGTRASEKLAVPTFSGDDSEDLGGSARSYLRQIEAWRRMTLLPVSQQGLVLYQSLSGKAWIAAEELSVPRLGSDDGVSHFVAWVNARTIHPGV